MKFLNIGLLAIGVVLMLSSCDQSCIDGSGNQVTETRKVNDFTKIDISGGYIIKLVQDSSLSLTVTADDNIQNYIKTDVSGDRLRISNKNICTSSGEVVVTVGVRNLEEIKASGAVEVSSSGKINARDMNINLSGSTKVALDINAARLTTNASGSSEINLKGQASEHDLKLSGSSNVNAFDLVTGVYNISTSGSSDCNINVLQELNVHSSGSSAIKYRGNPSSVNNDKSGSSSIEKVN
jgi:hypothetical protein